MDKLGLDEGPKSALCENGTERSSRREVSGAYPPSCALRGDGVRYRRFAQVGPLEFWRSLQLRLRLSSCSPAQQGRVTAFVGAVR